jgi:hypothetical protein
MTEETKAKVTEDSIQQRSRFLQDMDRGGTFIVTAAKNTPWFSLSAHPLPKNYLKQALR